MLVNDGSTLIKFENKRFPLWNANEHLLHLEGFDYTDIIICSENYECLLNCDLNKQLNYAAGLGWSGVKFAEKLFFHGYSKIFFGGVNRPLPSDCESDEFQKILTVYGASSFGFNFHVDIGSPVYPPQEFLENFSEISVIDPNLQVNSNIEKPELLMAFLEQISAAHSYEINLVTTFPVWREIQSLANLKFNHVNYCEHGINETLVCNV